MTAPRERRPGPARPGSGNETSRERHPEWCTQEHGTDDSVRLCAGPGRGFTTLSGGVVKVRPEQITTHRGDGKPESRIAVYGMRSPAVPGQERPFRLTIPAADARPLISLIKVLSGADRDQFAELVAGITDAQAAVTENEPEAGQ